VEKREGKKNQAGVNQNVAGGRVVHRERREHTRQDPEAQDQGEERAQSREGGRREERDVYSVCIMSHLCTLYPKLKFTSEFSLTPLKKLL
jgi:hypothetical protein